MTPTMRMTTCFLAMAPLALVAPVAAQDQNMRSGDHGVAEERRTELTPADRERAAYAMVDRWTQAAASRGYRIDGWRTELMAELGRADDGRFQRAMEAESYPEMVEALTGKNPDRIYAPGALGDKSIDLQFFPITPCRVMDTRIGTGAFAGPRQPGTTTSFVTNFTSNIAAQGGNPAGCPLPASDAGGIAFNVTVVDFPNSDGFATIFPATATRPNASTINYGPGSFPSPLANASIVQQCVICGNDVSVYVEGTAANVIVDVVGYFDLAPTGICSVNVTTDFDLNGACQNITSCSITNPANGRTRNVVCHAVVTPNIFHTQGTHDEFAISIETSSSTCDTFPWEGGTGHYDINQAVPSGQIWQNSVSAQGIDALAAGTTRTYYLNVIQELGNDASDDLDAAQLICTLLP